MRLFKATYKNRSGEKCKSKKWYLDFSDHLGRRHKMPAFESKKQSEALGRQIEELISCKVAGQRPDTELQRWIETLTSNFVKKFCNWGFIDKHRAGATKLLSEHLKDFRQAILDGGVLADRAKKAYGRTKKVFDGCGFGIWSDISASKIQNFIAGLQKGEKPISAKTCNYYLREVKQFCHWMVMDRRASESPVEHLRPMEATATFQRRALTANEMRQLLEATEALQTVFGMTGHERAMLYRFAVETGLRALEIRSLTVSSFDFDKAIVKVIAGDAKNRKEAVLPLRQDTAVMLKKLLLRKTPQAPVFNMAKRRRVATMLKADLRAAEINPDDNGQGKLDFHALRHTFGSMLAASGVDEALRYKFNDVTIYAHSQGARDKRLRL